MSQSASVYLVLLVALVAANLPFVNERLLAVLPVRWARKPLSVCLAELAALYFLTCGVGFLIERRLGQNAAQGWEFYVITASLFVVLAFPGFTWRYLVKHRRGPARA